MDMGGHNGVRPKNEAIRQGLLLLSFLPLTAAFAARLLFGYGNGPDAKLTGGFQENTCLRCHNTHGLNDGRVRGGIFEIDGVPRKYEPGHAYPLTVTIGQPGQSRWGFTLSSRFSGSGMQAGQLAPVDGLTQVKTESGIQYIEHSAEGTRKGETDGPVEFRFNWVAPVEAAGLVIFNAAGNSADGNGKPTGDFIYTAGNFTQPAATKQTETEVIEEITPVQVVKPARLQDTSRLASLPAPVDLKKGSVEIEIQHRFFDSLVDSGPGNAFGIDSGANINLGVNYALTNRISAGISRARADQIVAMSGGYEIRTAKDSPWKMSLLGGVEGRQNFQSHYSPFLQLPTSLDYRRVRFEVVPTFVFNSRPDALMEFLRPQAINPDSNHTIALGLGVDVAVAPRLSLIGEYVPRLAGFGGFGKTRPQLAGGVIIRTWGHAFTILVSTSRDFTPSRYGVNAEYSDVSLGFNIYRRIR